MKYKIQILAILALVLLSTVSTIATPETPVLIVAEEGFSSNAQVLVETVSACTYFCSYCVVTGYSCNAGGSCC